MKDKIIIAAGAAGLGMVVGANVYTVFNPSNSSLSDKISGVAPSKLARIDALIDQEFAGIVGMENAKEQLRKQFFHSEWQKRRRKKGKNVRPPTYHVILEGPPGVGKTTLARKYGKMLFKMGVLSSGHFIECDRSDLVAPFLGQTAIKVNSLIKSARGGILFIDEAYSLTDDPYAAEALATLVKGMEDYRDDLVVIIAGYPGPLSEFLESNPGLRSRFPHCISIDHYDGLTLCKIFDAELTSRDLVIEPNARDAAHLHLSQVAARREKSSGNGRYVRTFIERIESNVGYRVIGGQSAEESNGDVESTITLADVRAASSTCKA